VSTALRGARMALIVRREPRFRRRRSRHRSRRACIGVTICRCRSRDGALCPSRSIEPSRRRCLGPGWRWWRRRGLRGRCGRRRRRCRPRNRLLRLFILSVDRRNGRQNARHDERV